jgi:hypothetical protein
MNNGKTKQNSQIGQSEQNNQTQPHKKKQNVLVAIIGALALIICALIPVMCNIINSEVKITIYLVDAKTGEYLSGAVLIDNDENPTQINTTKGTTLSLKKGRHNIQAKSDGYRMNEETIDRVPETKDIKMHRINHEPTEPEPLSFSGWEAWTDELTLTEGLNINEITVEGTLDSAGGFFNNGLLSVLRGKTLVLYFSNVKESKFSRNKMVKLTYNRNDSLLRPVNEALLDGEYIPAKETPLDRGIEYPIPDNFDGKIGFVFYQATLNDLRITAYYK